MGRKDDAPTSIINAKHIQQWVNGEKMPDSVREQLDQWLRNPGKQTPNSEKIIGQALDGYVGNLLPVPDSELPRIDRLINNIVDGGLGRPLGTTTWMRARQGDAVAKEIIRRESRRPRRGPSK